MELREEGAVSGVSKLEIVAAAAVTFREIIGEYEGAPKGSKLYLLMGLRRMVLKGGAILPDQSQQDPHVTT